MSVVGDNAFVLPAAVRHENYWHRRQPTLPNCQRTEQLANVDSESAIVNRVELRGIEPLTFWLQTRRSPN